MKNRLLTLLCVINTTRYCDRQNKYFATVIPLDSGLHITKKSLLKNKYIHKITFEFV